VELLPGNNSTAPKRQGNTTEYLVARMQRDCPEMLDRLDAGEFPSVKAGRPTKREQEERNNYADSIISVEVPRALERDAERCKSSRLVYVSNDKA
jgi:hypothetical protein